MKKNVTPIVITSMIILSLISFIIFAETGKETSETPVEFLKFEDYSIGSLKPTHYASFSVPEHKEIVKLKLTTYEVEVGKKEIKKINKIKVSTKRFGVRFYYSIEGDRKFKVVE